jgi:transcriptional regulator PpsR
LSASRLPIERISKLKSTNASIAFPELLVQAPLDSLLELLKAASDFSVVLNKLGVVQRVEIHTEELLKELPFFGSNSWVDRAWADLVTIDSRPKVVALLRDAAIKSNHLASQAKASKPATKVIAAKALDHILWRQINYPRIDSNGIDLPANVAVISLGENGDVLVLSKDLRSVAALQQQLVDTQQAMERDYMKLRFMESRYRALLQTSLQGIAMVEAGTLKIADANDQAFQLLEESGKRRTTKVLPDYFDSESKVQLVAWLNRLSTTRSIAPSIDVILKHSGACLRVHASLLRQTDGVFYLVWLSTPQSTAPATQFTELPEFIAVFDHMPDSMIVTDTDGKILRANIAFAAMAQLVDGGHVIGEKISRWLARSELDFNLIANSLKQHQSFKQIAMEVKGEFGTTTLTEISGVVVQNGPSTFFGLCLRDVSRRPMSDMQNQTASQGLGLGQASKGMPRSVSELKELVGRVSLKDIVGETTDVIEQLCIEAALELTGDNRAAASEMLGLSRQSLYVKLRRFGVDTSPDGSAESLTN